MSSFLDRIGGGQMRGVPDDQDPENLIAADGLGQYVVEEARIQHVVVCGTEMTRRTEEWETTERAGDGSRSLVVVSDRRVIVLVGNCRDPDVDGDYVRYVPLEDVDAVVIDDSLLSTTFTLRDDEGVVLEMRPTVTDGLSDVAKFVRKARTRWESAQPILADLGGSTERIETAYATGDHEEAREEIETATEAISDVDISIFRRSVEIPLLQRRIEEGKEAISAARIRGRCRRCRSLLEERPLDSQNEVGETEIELHRAAAEELSNALDVRRENDSVVLDVEHGTDGAVDPPETLVRAVLENLSTLLDRDWQTVDGSDRIHTLYELLEGWETLSAAGEELDEGLTTAVEDGLAAIAEELDAALEAAAEAAEESGDALTDEGDTEGARDRYEAAIECLTRRIELSVDLPEGAHDVERTVLDAQHEQLEAKLGELEWIWGGE